MDSSLVLVRRPLVSHIFVAPAQFGIDAGLLTPMAVSLAEEDSEIGSRIGICFTFGSENSSPVPCRS
jgi:hypothetical protein